MAPSVVHSHGVRTPKRVPVMVRIEFRHLDLVLEFLYSEFVLTYWVSELEPQRFCMLVSV